MEKRSRVSISVRKEHRDTEVVSLYVKGYSQSDIVTEFEKRGDSISIPTIGVAIRNARKEWAANRVEDMDIVMQQELIKLDQMESDAAKDFVKFDPTNKASDLVLDIELEKRSEQALKWMATRIKIMEMRHRLLGMYKAPKQEIESKNLNINVTPEQIAETRNSIINKLCKINE